MAEETPNLPIKPTSPLERVQVAYLRHLGNSYLIAEETGLSVPEVKRYLAEIHEAEHKDPNQLTANNMAMYIISGCEMRTAHLTKQLNALDGRYQMWRSVCCQKPVEEVPATPGIPATDTTPEVLPTPVHYRCLGCNLGCSKELIDYPTICRVRNETLHGIREEIRLELHTLKELNIIGSAPKYVQNVKQDVLIIGGKQQDYLKLGPMEMDRLLKDLKTELVRMDSEVQKSDEEVAQAEAELAAEEAALAKEEGTRGREAIDIGGTAETVSGTPETAGGTQAGEREEAPRNTEEKG